MNLLMEQALLQRNYTHCITALHFWNIGLTGTKEIKKINCPVLVYHGEKDILIDYKVAKYNAKMIGKKKCILILKKNAGHAIAFEHPKDFTKTIILFA